MAVAPWRVFEETADPGQLVGPPGSLADGPSATFAMPTGRAVVLGSAQPNGDLDEEACTQAGYRVERRRSGGGAVIVAPGAQIWLDLFLPASDSRFDHDIVRGAGWIGELWCDAIGDVLGASEHLRVHRGGATTNHWSKLCCFLGAGPGEVFLGDRKVVGVAQRRTRAGAWFFTMAIVAHDPVESAGLFSERSGSHKELAQLLESGVATLGSEASAVERALRARLSG